LIARFLLIVALLAASACAARTVPVISATAAEELFADVRDDLARFEQPSNEARFDVLAGMLKSRGIPYEVEPFTVEPRKSDPRSQGRNVVVTVPGDSPEIVIGAHYDAVRLQDGALSKGIVDNAASVVILVRLAETLMKARPKSQLRIVFFDMEELGLLGSERYALTQRERKTLAMVNLDVNAFGDALIFGPRVASTAVVFQAMRQTCAEVARICVEFPRMPPSDDLSFQKAGVPTLSIATVAELQAHQLWLLINGEKESGLEERFLPQVLRTIHTAADNSSLADPRAMAQTYRAVLGLIRRLDR
jgi:Zn-dependent M28 family amino/carboxypeptidase